MELSQTELIREIKVQSAFNLTALNKQLVTKDNQDPPLRP